MIVRTANSFIRAKRVQRPTIIVGQGGVIRSAKSKIIAMPACQASGPASGPATARSVKAMRCVVQDKDRTSDQLERRLLWLSPIA